MVIVMTRKSNNKIWRKEPNLGISIAKSPQQGYDLSGVVAISGGRVRAGYIKFTDRAVRMIGRYMPYGIGPENQAYLKVLCNNHKITVVCKYLDRTKTVKLWESNMLPSWIKESTLEG